MPTKKPKGQWGGPRPGGGPKPDPFKRAVDDHRKRVMQMLHNATAEGKPTPLEYLLENMWDETLPRYQRVSIAKILAPYIHPRLNTVEVNNNNPDNTVNIQIRDFSKQQSPLQVIQHQNTVVESVVRSLADDDEEQYDNEEQSEYE